MSTVKQLSETVANQGKVLNEMLESLARTNAALLELLDKKSQTEKPKATRSERTQEQVREEKNRTLRAAVLALENEKKMYGLNWFYTKSGLKMGTFYSGPCFWHALLQQNSEKESWLAELVYEGWVIYWVCNYSPRRVEDTTCEKCEGSKIYTSDNGKEYKCLACKGTGIKLHTSCTNYLVVIRPGGEPENIQVNQLKNELGIVDETEF